MVVIDFSVRVMASLHYNCVCLRHTMYVQLPVLEYSVSQLRSFHSFTKKPIKMQQQQFKSSCPRNPLTCLLSHVMSDCYWVSRHTHQ